MYTTEELVRGEDSDSFVIKKLIKKVVDTERMSENRILINFVIRN